jgi:hypothetical protein
MSYKANCGGGYGAYYEFSPHQVFPYSGYGATAGIRQTFDAQQVWADAQKGGTIGALQTNYNNMGCLPNGEAPTAVKGAACRAAWQTMGNVNAAGGRAARAIQEGLNELGYGPIGVDGVWGGESSAAWGAFTADQGLPAGPGLVNKAGIDKMGALLHGGEAPGPAKAGMPTWGWLLIIAAGVGGVAMLSKKRARPVPTGKAMVPMR